MNDAVVRDPQALIATADEPVKVSLGKKKHGLLIATAPEQSHRRIAFEKVEAGPRRLAARAFEAAVAVEQQLRVALAIGASSATSSGVARRKPASPDWRVPRISPGPRSRRSSSAMRKPSLVSRIRASRALPVSRQHLAAQEQADALALAAPDAAAQLVELGEAEALGALDDHQRGVGHVDADLDDGGGDEHAQARRRRTTP